MLQHFVLVVGETGIDVVDRGELGPMPLSVDGSATFLASRGELLVYGGEQCDARGTPSEVMHVITLGR